MMSESPFDFHSPPPAHMHPECRRNPITGQWVIIAPERESRPVQTASRTTFTPLFEACPFCAGQEHLTPPELFAIRSEGSWANGPDWQVRVVPNRYPAVRDLIAQAPEHHWNSNGLAMDGASRLKSTQPGFGAHELIVESPHHESSLGNLPAAHLRHVVAAWRERLAFLSNDPRFQYAQVFKNHGPAAGASVVHCHSQLIALPLVPPFLQQELDAGQEYHTRFARCIFCDLLGSELDAGVRIVMESPHYVAIAAYAGRQPYETWILPRRHHCRFDAVQADEIDELAAMLSQLLQQLDKAIDRLAYNLILHTAPFHRAPLPYFHWHLEVLPRSSQVAGFEWGTGLHVNSVRPEEAARRLRATR